MQKNDDEVLRDILEQFQKIKMKQELNLMRNIKKNLKNYSECRWNK